MIAELFPEADLFFLLCDRNALAPSLRSRKITCSFLQKIPGALTHHRYLMPLYALAVENLDLREYDLVISSDSGPVKGVLTRPDAVHICYCYSPMRYLWDMYHVYRNEPELGAIAKLVFSVSAHYLRQWDVLASARVDHFVADSVHVSRRIRKYYRRDATVIYPPVDVPAMSGAARHGGDYYLYVGQLSAYKRADLAIRACEQLGRKLVVVGTGEMSRHLQQLAGSNVTFAGRLSDAELVEVYRHARALLFPGEEDFGIVPVEAQAHGKPVIAFGRGGARETIVAYGSGAGAPTGILFGEPTEESLIGAIATFESVEREFDPVVLQRNALRFATPRFRQEFRQMVDAICSANGFPAPAGTPRSAEHVAAVLGNGN